jgi:hypothetical protein
MTPTDSRSGWPHRYQQQIFKKTVEAIERCSPYVLSDNW